MKQKQKTTIRDQQAALLKRVARGDENALESFYNGYFQRLYRYVFYRVGRDHQHTEDVVNDTFMEALEKAKLYDAKRGSIESWIITLSRNRIRSLNNTLGRARDYEKSWGLLDGEMESVFADFDAAALPEAALESEELKDLIGAAMGSIPENYSTLLEMKYRLNLSVREIALKLHKTEKAVESQLTRARVAFREIFKVIAVDLPSIGIPELR